MDYYHHYLRTRLETKVTTPSLIEQAIVKAIDNLDAHDDFVVLVMLKNEYYWCNCSFSRDTLQFTLNKMVSCGHSLAKVFSPTAVDEETASQFEYAYFNNKGVIEFEEYICTEFPELQEYNISISEALGAMQSDPSVPIFACGEFIDKNSVLYRLQQKYKNATRIALTRDDELKGISNFPGKMVHELINTSSPLTFADFTRAESSPIFIPDDVDTLKSTFWNDTKWGDLIPEGCEKSVIGNTACFALFIRFENDCFGNIFCRADDGNNHIHYSLIHAPWGAL